MIRRKKEASIQAKGRKLAKDWLGVKSSKFEGASENGKPDVIFWLPLLWGCKGPYLWEAKRPGEVAGALQKDKHKEWRELGYSIGTFDNEHDILAALIEALETPRLPEEGRQILDSAKERLASARAGTR